MPKENKMRGPRITVERRTSMHDESDALYLPRSYGVWLVVVDIESNTEAVPCWTRRGARRLARRMQQEAGK